MYEIELEYLGHIEFDGELRPARVALIRCENYEIKDGVLTCIDGSSGYILHCQDSGTSETKFTRRIFPLHHVSEVTISESAATTS